VSCTRSRQRIHDRDAHQRAAVERAGEGRPAVEGGVEQRGVLLSLAGRPAAHVEVGRLQLQLAVAQHVDALDHLGAVDRPDRRHLVAR
jgi:hypothetical protein